MSQAALESAVRRVQRGDTAAFEYIYDHTYKVVYFVAHNILRDRHAAEDIVHDAYITAYKNLAAYTANSFLAWLTTIARRLAINEYNKRKRSVSVDFSEHGDAFGGVTNIPSEECLGLIGDAQKLLSEEDYTILIMCAVSGYKRREVADALGMPVSTVTHRYTQSLKKLEKKINGEDGQ